MNHRCNHENTKKEYRVICEDCGVVIMPDILDRMRNIMDYLRMNLDKYDKFETSISIIESDISEIKSSLNIK